MTLPIYLAMTDAEMHRCSPLPDHTAFMACHFSPYGTGICNLPTALPAESMLILNDRIPICNHDPEEILAQLNRLLEEITFCGLLLDFQRESYTQCHAITKLLAEKLPLPVGVSQPYARDLDCPVFVDPPAFHVPLSEHLKPWEGRQIWLDAALSAVCYRVDKSGCTQTPCNRPSEPLPQHDAQLHCHYRIQQESDHVAFTLTRAKEDLQDLLSEGQTIGVTAAIGLYQEWSQFP